jgi:hypothetical protein
MSKVCCKKIDLEKLDLKKVYIFEYINDQLKDQSLEINGKSTNLFEFDNGKLILIPQTSYSKEKVISEIVNN